MKIFKPSGDLILGFDNIKTFVLFTLGRICGIIIFLLMIDGFNYYLYTQGYSDKFTSVFNIIILIFKLFI
jgi:hypothetical protein